MSDAPNGVALDAARETGPVIRAIAPAVEFRAEGEDDSRPTMFGYFSRFNEWTEINSYFEGQFMERIQPGAYRKTFRERRNELRVLFQHGRDPEIGDKPIAEIVELREDDEGAYQESRLFDGLPPLILSGLRAGQYGQSFRMEIMREEWVEEPKPSDANPAGLPERTIKEIRLHEFGPVTFPAYKNTTAGVRSLTDEFVFEWLAREPQRARELIGAHDLTRAAMKAADEQDEHKQDAPSDTDAATARTSGTPDDAQGSTSAQERRDTPNPGRYGLTTTDPRPSWAL